MKSGINSAIPVTPQITSDLITTDFNFLNPFVPVLKKGCYSAISKAARICIGYETKALMHTQKRTNVTRPLIGTRLRVKIGLVSSL